MKPAVAAPALLVIAVLAGCSRDGSPAGRAGLPPAGHVRIVPTRIQEDARHFSWLWTVMGERNWTTTKASAYDLRLSGSYPMNSKDRVGGTHIWEARVTIAPSAATGPSPGYLLQVQLRGSNAAMSSSNTTIDAGSDGSLTNVARAAQTSDVTLSLPATVVLASVGRRNVTLKIDP